MHITWSEWERVHRNGIGIGLPHTVDNRDAVGILSDFVQTAINIALGARREIGRDRCPRRAAFTALNRVVRFVARLVCPGKVDFMRRTRRDCEIGWTSRSRVMDYVIA